MNTQNTAVPSKLFQLNWQYLSLSLSLSLSFSEWLMIARLLAPVLLTHPLAFLAAHCSQRVCSYVCDALHTCAQMTIDPKTHKPAVWPNHTHKLEPGMLCVYHMHV